MKIIRAAALLTLITLFAVPMFGMNAASASTSNSPSAATPKTVSITANEINAALHVTDPARRISNVHIDLQTGKLLIYATVTLPTKAAYQTVSTFKMKVNGGMMTWQMVGATANGKSAPIAVNLLLNQFVYSGWRTAFTSAFKRKITGVYNITAATISSGVVKITYINPTKG